jgi:predicted glycosyltransferase
MRALRSAPRRIFVYCHDAYGLGNARRMLAIARHLSGAWPQANLLLASGSAVMHGFRLPDRVDYIKLPSVARTDREQYATRYLTTQITDTIRLRRALLTAAVADFSPDLLLVDKKPFGIMHELEDAVQYLHAARPDARFALILRDILDAPDATIPCMQASSFERDVNTWFDMVAVLGTPDVFDMRHEYGLSDRTSAQIEYCGYLRSQAPARDPRAVRAELGIGGDERLVLVTPGGGEDGHHVLDASMAALEHLRMHGGRAVRALVVTGPHLPAEHLAALRGRAAARGGVVVREFTDDMSSYTTAADLVVSMGGYNTVCDVLTLAGRAVVVPRVRPVREQAIRAARMTRLGYFTTMHPDGLSGEGLAALMARELSQPAQHGRRAVDLEGLPRLAARLAALYDDPALDLRASRAAFGAGVRVPVRVREAS